MNKRNKYILIIVYAVLVLSLIVYFVMQNRKAYTYSYSADSVSLNAGEVTADGQTWEIDESSGFNGVFIDAYDAHLRTGNYCIVINYESTSDNALHLSPNSNYDEYIPLPASETQVVQSFSVWPTTTDGLINIIYNGAGKLSVHSISLVSDKPIYTDYIYFILLTVLLAVAIPLILAFLIKNKKMNASQWKVLGILTVIDLAVNFPLVYGYLWQGIDMIPHLGRADGVRSALSMHRIPAILYPTVNVYYGDLGCIYPDKFLYLPAILRKCGVSEVASYGTMHFLINTLAIVLMFYCVNHITKSYYCATVSAFLFCLAPNRLYIMNRGGQTYGQGISILFIPIIIVGLYEILFNDGKKWWLLSLGVTGVLCSHMISLALSAVLCFSTFCFCEIVLIRQKRGKEFQLSVFRRILACIGMFLLLGLSTIAPFLYYFRNLTTEQYSDNKDFIMSLSNLEYNFLSENGIFHIVLLIVAIILFTLYRRNKVSLESKCYRAYCIYLIVGGFIMFWLTTRAFPWVWFEGTALMDNMNKFQFAERFMIIGVPMLCVGIGMLIKPLFDNNQFNTRTFRSIVGVVAIFVLCLGIHKVSHDFNSCEVLLPDRVAGNIICYEKYFIPPGCNPKTESPTPVCPDWNSVNNISYIRNGDNIHYEYTCSADNLYVDFPAYYFEGYVAYNDKGEEVPLVDNEKKHIRINLIKGDEPNTVDIKFTVPFFVKICAAISALATIWIYSVIVLNHCRKGPLTNKLQYKKMEKSNA